MDFDFNDEQREIKATAREFLASRFTPEKVRELAESDSPYDDALWGEICELGWPGIVLPEEYGGSGLTAVRIAPFEGRVYFYEPSMNQVKTLLTNEAVGAATYGAVKVENIDDMGIKKVAAGEYEVSVDVDVKLLWFIPVKMQGKATVDTQDRQVSYGDVSVKRIDKPWWSMLVTGVVDNAVDSAEDAILSEPPRT